jgi:membrane-associated protein
LTLDLALDEHHEFATSGGAQEPREPKNQNTENPGTRTPEPQNLENSENPENPCGVHSSAMLDLLLHADEILASLVTQYGTTVYAILFAIIFAETGLVVTPFLPGDSLLFAAGALSGTGALRAEIVVPLLIVAAVVGDAVNYSVGCRLAHRFLEGEDRNTGLHRWVKRQHVQRAHAFFVKHGGKAVVLARFVPIVRTFVPFVAGGADMPYRAFAFYNVTGAILWVGVCVGAGVLFGNIPVVKENFELVVLGIVAVSVLPLAIELLKAVMGRSAGREEVETP